MWVWYPAPTAVSWATKKKNKCPCVVYLRAGWSPPPKSKKSELSHNRTAFQFQRKSFWRGQSANFCSAAINIRQGHVLRYKVSRRQDSEGMESKPTLGAWGEGEHVGSQPQLDYTARRAQAETWLLQFSGHLLHIFPRSKVSREEYGENLSLWT